MVTSAYFYAPPSFLSEDFSLVRKHGGKEPIGWEGTVFSYQLGLERLKMRSLYRLVGYQPVWMALSHPPWGIPHVDHLAGSVGLGRERSILFPVSRVDWDGRGMAWLSGWPQRVILPAWEERIREENVQRVWCDVRTFRAECHQTQECAWRQVHLDPRGRT